MGFIDTSDLPRTAPQSSLAAAPAVQAGQSDLLRYADPRRRIREMAIEDLARSMTPSRTAPARQPAQGQPTAGQPAAQPRRTIMPMQQWVETNYPWLVQSPVITREMLRHVQDSYKTYLATESLRQEEELGMLAARLRSAELAQRAAAKARSDYLSGMSHELRAAELGVRREELQEKRAARKAKPSATTRLPGSQVSRLFDTLRSLGDAIVYEDRFSGERTTWADVYRQVEQYKSFADEPTRAAMDELLRKTRPTRDQVVQALDAGEVSEDEAVELLELILPPQEFEKWRETAEQQQPSRINAIRRAMQIAPLAPFVK
jgi:hypothetical protein